jgi:recombination protein RecA
VSIVKDLLGDVGEAAVDIAKKAAITAPKTMEDKISTLRAVEKVLNKQFDVTRSLVRFSDRVNVRLPSIATNIASLDEYVIQCGGIPRGKIIEIFGPEASGKTTFALEIIAQEQANTDNLVAFVDAEHALDPNYADKLGVDMDQLIISQPDSGEQALETTQALIESQCVSLIVIDSVAALVPQAELDGEMGDSNMGLQARLMSQAMRKLRGVASIHGVSLVFINQMRDKIGVMFGSPETTTGGKALRYYASLRFDLRKRDLIKSGSDILGHKMEIKAAKNKVGSPYRSTIVDLIYGEGIDRESDLISYASKVGVIEVAGKWHKFNGEIIGDGLEKTIINVKENRELYEKIKKGVKGLK